VDQPQTLAQVLERVHTSWAALFDTIAGLTDRQLVEPGPEGWSVKDHLAHVMAWEQAPTAILGGRHQREAFGLDEAAYERIDSVDQLNARVYERYRDLPLDQVRSDMTRVHEQLVAALEGLTDADLGRTIGSFGGDPEDQRPLLDKIEGDSWGHYADHAGWLRELRSAIE
jgi:hypothetical protein